MSEELEDLFDPRALFSGDQGATEMVIFTHEGKVIQRFREPRLWVAYDPSNAAELANKFLDAAKECGAQIVINIPRRQVSPIKRMALITRAMHVYRSMTEKGRPPKDVAQHVVDSILSAID
jgi:hypothetical protein